MTSPVVYGTVDNPMLQCCMLPTATHIVSQISLKCYVLCSQVMKGTSQVKVL